MAVSAGSDPAALMALADRLQELGDPVWKVVARHYGHPTTWFGGDPPADGLITDDIPEDRPLKVLLPQQFWRHRDVDGWLHASRYCSRFMPLRVGGWFPAVTLFVRRHARDPQRPWLHLHTTFRAPVTWAELREVAAYYGAPVVGRRTRSMGRPPPPRPERAAVPYPPFDHGDYPEWR